MLQRTLSRPIWFRGIGLHCGRPQEIQISPSASGSGVRFVTIENHYISAELCHVQRPLQLCTALFCSLSSARVQTTEHLLAALYALNIHNAEVRFLSSGPHEVPIMDGSSRSFAEVMARHVVQSLPHAPVEEISIPHAIDVQGPAGQTARVEPNDGLGLELVESVDDFNRRLPKCSPFWYSSVQSGFIEELAGARTLVFESEIEYVRRMGLGLGGSLRNCVVFADVEGSVGQVRNKGGLRFRDEWLRHKVLDCIGDLALLRPCSRLHAKITVDRPGHHFNNDIAQAIMQSVSLDKND